MSGTIELMTERLVLRRYKIEDARELHLHFGLDEQMFEFSGWNPYETEEKAMETVREFIASYEDDHFYGWAAEKDGELIGTAGAYDYDPVQNTIEIGLSIRKDHWNKGYASEIMGCILKYLSDAEKIKTITAWCASDNTGSERAMIKSGMTKVSEEKDALVIGGNSFDKLNYAYNG